MKKTNYVANGVAMRCLNKSVVTINATLHLLDIYMSGHKFQPTP